METKQKYKILFIIVPIIGTISFLIYSFLPLFTLEKKDSLSDNDTMSLIGYLFTSLNVAKDDYLLINTEYLKYPFFVIALLLKVILIIIGVLIYLKKSYKSLMALNIIALILSITTLILSFGLLDIPNYDTNTLILSLIGINYVASIFNCSINFYSIKKETRKTEIRDNQKYKILIMLLYLIALASYLPVLLILLFFPF